MDQAEAVTSALGIARITPRGVEPLDGLSTLNAGGRSKGGATPIAPARAAFRGGNRQNLIIVFYRATVNDRVIGYY